MPLRIVTRKEWALVAPTEGPDGVRKSSRVFLQNAYTDTCEDEQVCQGTVRELHYRHTNQVQGDIRFNFVIGGDGNVYEARGWNICPKMPKKYMKHGYYSILIGLLGNYSYETIPEKIHDATCDLIKYGVGQGYIAVDYQYYDIMEQHQLSGESRRHHWHQKNGFTYGPA